MDFFDFSNIKGRAGRMLQHYTGKVYIFNVIPNKEDVNLDIPYHDQKLINDEILASLSRNEVKNEHVERYEEIHNYDENLLNVIKKNAVSISGQKKVIKELINKLNESPDLVLWDKFPNWEQLSFVISLAWDNFLKPSETTLPMTKKKLPVTIRNHVKYDLPILINTEMNYLQKRNKKWGTDRLMDTAIENVFRE